jgi:hypothetical protein
MLDVGQQMGEIALKRENPVMLAKRIDKRGIRMVKPTSADGGWLSSAA